MKNVKPILIFLTFLIIFTSQTKGEENEYILGINFGYSFGLADSSSYYDNHKLGYRFGLNLQYYLSLHWAIQGEINYQKETCYIWGVEDYSYIAAYLNLICDFKKKSLSPYLSAGLGVEDFSLLRFDFKIGGGIKYYFSSQIDLNLGASFSSVVYELGVFVFPGIFIDYWNFAIGLEYRF